MLKLRTKQNDFPPLQKRIILHLAQNMPQTINQAKIGIKKDYKSSWIAFDALKRKGLIKEVTSKFHRGREYPQFWLTDRGMFLALYLGAVPQTILRRTIEIYPEDEDSQFLIEFASAFGEHAFNLLYLTLMNKGVIGEISLIFLLVEQMPRNLSPEEARQSLAPLRKYPRQYQRLSDVIKQTSKTLAEFADLL